MPLKPGVNPYKVLAIEKGCTEKEIQKAYRLQCLKWHPDKNLNNKEEAEKRFIDAKEAFEFLFDKKNREEYDKGVEKVRVAEERQKQRMEKADGERRRLIEELNKREQEFSNGLKRSTPSDETPVNTVNELKRKKQNERNIRNEMEEIRKQLEKEANEEVKKQMERIKLAHMQHKQKVDEAVTPKLILKWKVTDDDYKENDLKVIFEPYGKIANISSIIAKNDRRKCIVEFEMGENAWGAETETGLSPAPELKGEWLNPPTSETVTKTNRNNQGTSDFNSMSLEDLEAQILGKI